MNKYECAVVLNPTAGQDVLDSSAKKYSEIITSGGGTLTELDDWGKRSLAYEIDDYREGVYRFYRFEGAAAIVDELNRQLRIDENVLRHMIVRDESHRQAKNRPPREEHRDDHRDDHRDKRAGSRERS